MTRGAFIVFEGIDGSGKTTHLNALAKRLRQRGKTVIETREPGGTPRAEALRKALWNGTPHAVETALLMLFAARKDHWDQKIAPALSAGHWVLCDRFIDSTYAYQGYGEGVPLARIAALEQWVGTAWQPSALVWLTVDPSVAQTRRRVRQAALGTDTAAVTDFVGFDGETVAFFERVTAGYRERVAQHPCALTLDTRPPTEQVEATLDLWLAQAVFPRFPL